MLLIATLYYVFTVFEYIGSPANLQAYHAVLQTHDRIMSLDLPHGGQYV